MIEARAYQRFKKIIVVYCNRETQINRIMKREKVTRKEALQRIASQLSSTEKKLFADYLINTSGPFAYTQETGGCGLPKAKTAFHGEATTAKERAREVIGPGLCGGSAAARAGSSRAAVTMLAGDDPPTVQPRKIELRDVPWGRRGVLPGPAFDSNRESYKMPFHPIEIVFLHIKPLTAAGLKA